jgi:cysteine desulfurase/selenocysteine lyase
MLWQLGLKISGHGHLANKLRHEMEKLPHVLVHDIGDLKSGLVSFTVKGKSAQEVKTFLHQHAINVSWNGVSNTYLDMTSRDLKEVVRASVHYYNTEEEIYRFIEVLGKIMDVKP